jgi:GNAT superfamily N-acetyltransferase
VQDLQMIRKARLSDAKTILDVFKSTPELQASTEGEALYSEKYVRACIRDRKTGLVLVVEEDKKIAGVLNAEIKKSRKYSFLMDFVVLPEYRSRGVGARLYDYYENYCRKQGLETIVALVQVRNKDMQRFCGKKGLKKGYEFYMYEKEI